MSRGKASIGTPDREKAGTPKPAKARASTPAQQRRTAAKAPPASKRSPQRTVASAAEPQAGPATLKQVAAALARSRREDAHALIEAGRMSVAGVQALLERRIDTLREALSELRAVGKLMSHAGARETVAHVDELARGAVELTLATFVVPLLGHERGLSASVIGSILGAFATAAAVIRVLMPIVAERLRERVVVAGAMVATAVLFGVYPLLHSALAMGVCSVLLGFALGSVQPMVMSLLHQITPPARHGEALGLRLMAINASSVLMPMLFGSAGAVIGVGGLFWVVGVCVGLAGC